MDSTKAIVVLVMVIAICSVLVLGAKTANATGGTIAEKLSCIKGSCTHETCSAQGCQAATTGTCGCKPAQTCQTGCSPDKCAQNSCGALAGGTCNCGK